MSDFTIQIADRHVRISSLHENTYKFFTEYLHDAASDFSVEIFPEDLTFEREKSRREDELEGLPIREYSDSYLETIAIQRKIAEQLFRYDTLLFHGSVIAVDGAAYLFTAKSGTGKSTHTRLWREMLGSRAVMVNDDKPFLQITGSGVTAFGSPWNGKHGLGQNIAVPLKAICILERGEENRICEIPAQEAVFMLLQQSNRPMDKRMTAHYMDLLDQLSRSVSFYRLRCNMELDAARISFFTMAHE